MADSGTGIQELMAAETRASQIVAEARIGTQFGCGGGAALTMRLACPRGRHCGAARQHILADPTLVLH